MLRRILPAPLRTSTQLTKSTTGSSWRMCHQRWSTKWLTRGLSRKTKKVVITFCRESTKIRPLSKIKSNFSTRSALGYALESATNTTRLCSSKRNVGWDSAPLAAISLAVQCWARIPRSSTSKILALRSTRLSCLTLWISTSSPSCLSRN